jgi:cellobiose PTS system EIIC component
VINLAISMVIYYPFFRVWDRLKQREEQQSEQQAQAVTGSAVVS